MVSANGVALGWGLDIPGGSGIFSHVIDRTLFQYLNEQVVVVKDVLEE